MKQFHRVAVLLFAIVLTAFSCTAQYKDFAVGKTFHIKSGGWDYLAVSPVTDWLYVSHGTQVNILNKTTGDSVGVITGTTGVHGIVFAPETGKGFISNGRLNKVFVFALATNRILDSIATGANPDAMCYDSYSKRLIVGNGKSNDATVIDAVTGKVAATVVLGGKPEASVSDGAGKVYINLEDKNEVAVLDMATLKVSARYALAGGEEPAGLAIDPATGDLFVGCSNKKLIVLSARTGKQKAIIPIGEHCDGMVFDAGSGCAFAANGAGTLSIIRQVDDGYKVSSVPTKRGARTIAVDPATHLLYLPTADFEPQPAGAKERPKMIAGTFQILVVGR